MDSNHLDLDPKEIIRHMETIEARIDFLGGRIANSSAAARPYHIRELKALQWLVRRNETLTIIESGMANRKLRQPPAQGRKAA